MEQKIVASVFGQVPVKREGGAYFRVGSAQFDLPMDYKELDTLLEAWGVKGDEAERIKRSNLLHMTLKALRNNGRTVKVSVTKKERKTNMEELGAENIKLEALNKHYAEGVIHPWDAMEHWMTHDQYMGFLRGNAIKYLARAGRKGPARDDYKKALEYVQKLLESM